MPRKTPELLDPDRYDFGVEIGTRHADLDPNGHINNVAIAAVIEDARTRFGLAVLRDAATPGSGMMAAAAHVDYVAEARYPATFLVKVGLLDLGRTSWTIAELALQGGQPRAFCRTTMVYMEAKRPAPLPQGFRDALEATRVRLG
jgi:acyl-CoA thioester hydrolase